MTPSRRASSCLVLACGLAAGCLAQTAPGRPASAPAAKANAGGPSWSALTPSQRQALAPLQHDWPGLDAPRKAKWLELSSRFSTLPPDEQQRVQARMAEWAGLTPAERGQARWSFLETQQLSREQKQRHWEAYQALSDEERRALAARARPVDERQRPASAAAAKPVAAPARPAAAAASAAAKPQPKAQVKPVAPTIVQAKPGATTTLMTKTAIPPAHQQQQPGQPRIAAQPGQVDSRTLLPKSGPQAAASAPRHP